MSGESDEPVPGMRYSLVICADPPRLYRGVSDTNGLTGYAAAPTAAVLLFLDGAQFAIGDGDEPATASDAVEAASRCRSHREDRDAGGT